MGQLFVCFFFLSLSFSFFFSSSLSRGWTNALCNESIRVLTSRLTGDSLNENLNYRIKKNWKNQILFSSVQFSHSVMSDSLWPHGLQHARLPCPSPTPRDYSDSCPLNRWCHPTILSSVVPFFSHLQSFLALWSFQMSQLFTSGGQNTGVPLQHQPF